MYGETVDSVDPHRFEQELQRLKAARGVSQDVELTADDLAGLVTTFQEIYEQDAGRPFPQDANEQLIRAVVAVFDSWETPRAQVYRRAHDIPDDLGTAVNIVQMVFGNKGERSGTGVAFTRNPSTGEAVAFGEFLVDAQGEDVVAGIRTPEQLAAMQQRLPAAYAELLETMRESRGALPRHAGHRVHGRGRQALSPPDPHRQADGGGCAEGGGGHGRGGPDHAGGGGGAHRPGAARPAAAPDDRPRPARRGDRYGAQRFPRGRLRQGRARRRPRGGARQGRRGGDPRPLGDDARRHPRLAPGTGRADRPRRHDLTRRRRRSRDGQAVRGRLRGARHRHGHPSRLDQRPRACGRRPADDRRRHRPRHPRPRRARAAADQRGLRDGARVGGRAAPPAGFARTPTRPRMRRRLASSGPRESASAVPSTCS